MSDANAYVADLRAERDRLLAVVARVEGLAADLDREGVVQLFHGPHNRNQLTTARIRAALSAPSPSAEQLYTETDVPTPAGPSRGSQGAGDGV